MNVPSSSSQSLISRKAIQNMACLQPLAVLQARSQKGKKQARQAVQQLVSSLRPTLFLPQETIFVAGSEANSVYFLSTGSVRMVIPAVFDKVTPAPAAPANSLESDLKFCVVTGDADVASRSSSGVVASVLYARTRRSHSGAARATPPFQSSVSESNRSLHSQTAESYNKRTIGMESLCNSNKDRLQFSDTTVAKGYLTSAMCLSFCECCVLDAGKFWETLEVIADDDIGTSKAGVVRERLQKWYTSYKTDLKRCSQNAALLQCSGTLGGDEGHPLTLSGAMPIMNDLEADAFDEFVSHDLSHTQTWWRHPDSKERTVWRMLMLLIALYTGFSVPYRLAFPVRYVGLEWAFDVLSIVDVWLNMFYFSYFEHGRLQIQSNKIRRQYMNKNRFWLDAFAVVPYDVFALIPYFLGTTREALSLLAFLRIPKMLRLLSAYFYLQPDQNVALMNAYDISLGRFFALSELLTKVVLVAHLAACGYCIIARYEGATYVTWTGEAPACTGLDDSRPFQDGMTEYAYCRWGQSWYKLQVVSDLLSSKVGGNFQRYVRSFYWALTTLVVVVIGDVTPINELETLYVFLVLMLGLCVNGYVIARMSDIVANIDSDVVDIQSKRDTIESWMDRKQIPVRLRDRVRDYAEYITHSSSLERHATTRIIEEIPECFKRDLRERQRVEFVHLCPEFEEAAPPFLAKVLQDSLWCHFSPGDIIVNYDDIAHAFWMCLPRSVVVTKSLEPQHLAAEGCVRSPSQRRLKRWKSNEGFLECDMDIRSFGHEALVQWPLYCHTVCASDYIDCYSLSADRIRELELQFDGEMQDVRTKSLEVLGASKNTSMRSSSSPPGRSTSGTFPKFDGRPPSLLDFIESDDMSEIESMKMPVFSQSSFRRLKRMEHKAHDTKVYWKYLGTVRVGTSASREVWVPKGLDVRAVSDYITVAFLPYSWGRLAWVSLYWLTVYGFAGFFVPFRACFLIEPRPHDQGAPVAPALWYAFDTPVLLFWAVNAYFRATFFPFVEEGHLVLNWQHIRHNRRHENPVTFWLQIGVVAAALFLSPFAFVTGIEGLKFLLLPMFLKVLMVPRLTAEIFRIVQYRRASWVSASAQKVFLVFALLFVFNHVFACIWFAIHRYAEPGQHRTWATQDGLAHFVQAESAHTICDVGIARCYLRAVYFVITAQSTVGYGDIRPYTILETLYEAFVCTFSAIYFGAIIGILALWLSSLDTGGSQPFVKNLEGLENIMSGMHVDASFREEVRQYCHCLFEKSNIAADDNSVMEWLPATLRLEMSMMAKRSVMDHNPFLQTLSWFLRRRLALVLTPRWIRAHDNAQAVGDLRESEVVFIGSGLVEVTFGKDSLERSYFHLHKGDQYGLLNGALNPGPHRRADGKMEVRPSRLPESHKTAHGSAFGSIDESRCWTGLVCFENVQALEHTEMYCLAERDAREFTEQFVPRAEEEDFWLRLRDASLACLDTGLRRAAQSNLQRSQSISSLDSSDSDYNSPHTPLSARSTGSQRTSALSLASRLLSRRLSSGQDQNDVGPRRVVQLKSNTAITTISEYLNGLFSVTSGTPAGYDGRAVNNHHEDSNRGGVELGLSPRERGAGAGCFVAGAEEAGNTGIQVEEKSTATTGLALEIGVGSEDQGAPVDSSSAPFLVDFVRNLWWGGSSAPTPVSTRSSIDGTTSIITENMEKPVATLIDGEECAPEHVTGELKDSAVLPTMSPPPEEEKDGDISPAAHASADIESVEVGTMRLRVVIPGK
jgi:hypothetical protein